MVFAAHDMRDAHLGIVDAAPSGDRVVYARSLTTLATVDLTHGHPKRVSAELRTFLTQFVED